MAAAAPAAPTTTAPSGVRIIDTPPPSPPPAPTTSIAVSSIAPPAESALSKPGSAMERLRNDLRAKGKDPNAPTNPPPAKKQVPQKTATARPEDNAAASPEGEPGVTKPAPGSPEAEAEAAAAATAPETTAPATDPKAGKVSPWKLVDQYKSRIASVEKELADTKAANLPEQQRKEYLTQIEKLQARNKELEDNIRFVDYTKSTEYQTKYQQPYEAAWQRAMSELSEIPISTPDGQQRSATSDDLLQLVNLPLGKAREIADEVFGAFANDVMQHRKEIRTLFESQARALKEARESGAAREKQQAELSAKTAEETKGFIRQVWEKSHETIHKDPEHGKWFTPIEGDQDGNQRLAKGFELVDRAFTENPEAPGLTQEQRASIVQRHVAVRNRAAAYGRLVATVKKLEAEKAELNKQLEAYGKSTPEAGTSEPGKTSAGPASARENIFAELRKRAK